MLAMVKSLRLVLLLALANVAGITIKAQTAGIFFRENKGQVTDQYGNARPDIIASGSHAGLTWHLDKRGIHYQLTQSSNAEESGYPNNNWQTGITNRSTTIYRTDVQWLGANPNPEVIFSNPLPGFEHYYNVPNGSSPALYVQRYKEVRYKNVYPGIDVRFYEKEGQLEYDFELQPYAHAAQIKMHYAGAHLMVNSQNQLVLHTPLGQIQEGQLMVWQGNQKIEAAWQQQGSTVGFNLGAYNPALPLRIDPPVRVWGTYYGGSGNDYGYGLDTDTEGNVYLSGFTNTTAVGTIATTGAHQTTYTGTGAAYLAKFNTNGVRLWATYYGGNSTIGYQVAVRNGAVVLAGSTLAGTNITTAGAHQTTFGGGSTSATDGFVAKFNSNGVRAWGTYIGGTGSDGINGCAIDASDNIYVSGRTASSTAIATTGAQQASFGGGNNDVFLVKLNSAGQRQWGTYLGGSADEVNTGCALDKDGNVYLTGYTFSTTSISTTGAHQVNLAGSRDAFLVKYNPQGVRLWGTYYGGTGQDAGMGIAVDTAANMVYITGEAQSTSGFTTTGAHQTTKSGGMYDAFLAKFNANGQRQWGTYMGGSNEDQGSSVTVDREGNIIISGNTLSTNNIATTGAYQATYNGNYDCYLIKFNTSGVRQWGTYYGGNSLEYAGFVKAAANGSLYLGTSTISGDGIASSGSHQSTHGSADAAFDAMLVRFTDNTLPLNLMDFTANYQAAAHQVLLQWHTAQEWQTAAFEVQRQLAGSGWKAIAQQKAAGNSLSKRRYTCTDDKLEEGPHTYRLKMIDTDGSFSYSPTAVVWVKAGKTWQVWPTLTSGRQVQVRLSQPGTVSITDGQGKRLLSYNLGAGQHTLPLPAAAGIYFVQHQQLAQVQKIVVQ